MVFRVYFALGKLIKKGSKFTHSGMGRRTSVLRLAEVKRLLLMTEATLDAWENGKETGNDNDLCSHRKI
jgi:hypothetical protein